MDSPVNSGAIRGRGFQLVLLATAMAVAGYVRTGISPLQEAIRTALSLSDNQMAFLQGPVVGVPFVLASIPFGVMVDRTLRTRLLFTLALLSLLGSSLTALATNFNVLLLARGLAGVTALGIVPVVFSVLADLYPPPLRGRVTTVAIVGQVIGNSTAFLLGGRLLAVAGREASAWKFAMGGLTAPLIVATLLMLALREPARTGAIIEKPSLLQVWQELRTYRAVATLLALGIVLTETAFGAMLIWSAPMLSRRFALTPDRIGAILAFGMLVSGILGPIAGGLIADAGQRQGGPARTMATLAALALLGIPCSLFAFMPDVVLTCTLLILTMALMLAIAVMGMALFTIVIPGEMRGLCMSMLMAAILFFALAVAPLTVSVLSGPLGGTNAIGPALSLVCIAASLLAAGAFTLGRRHGRRIVPALVPSG
jgi:MFS family permease